MTDILQRLRGRDWASAANVTMLVGWMGRVVAGVAQFAAIRILTQMLGIEGYGAYAVITGLQAWFLLADFGLGSSLQNHISSKRVHGQSSDAEIWAVSIFLIVSTLAVLVLLAVLSPWLAPYLLRQFNVITDAEARTGFFAFGAITVCTGAASIILKVFFAQFKGYISHAITVGGSIMGVSAVYAVSSFEFSSKLVWAIVAYFLPGFLLPFLSMTFYLARRAGSLRASGMVNSISIVVSLFKSARWFFLFAILGACTLNSDFVILSASVSPYDIAVYAVFAKAYTLAIALYASVLSAYWPISAELIVQEKFVDLKNLIRKALMIGVVIVGGAATFMLLFLDVIGELLSPGQPLVLPSYLVGLFTVYCLARVWTDTFSMVIVSSGRAWVPCIVVPFQALASGGLAYWGAVNYGLPGFMAGLIIAFAGTVMWVFPTYVNKRIAIARDGIAHA